MKIIYRIKLRTFLLEFSAKLVDLIAGGRERQVTARELRELGITGHDQSRMRNTGEHVYHAGLDAFIVRTSAGFSMIAEAIV